MAFKHFVTGTALIAALALPTGALARHGGGHPHAGHRPGGGFHHGGVHHGGVHHGGGFHRPGGFHPHHPGVHHRPGFHPGYRPPVVRPGWGYGGWHRPGYGWRPGGAIAAGAALGFLTAAAASSAAPAPGLCWYYTNRARTAGFWDYCP
jgi:hypothetical protein